MNKKGQENWLGTETGKLVITLACIILLFIGTYTAISHFFFQQSDIDIAKASLNKIISDANSGFTESTVMNPKGWVITSYPQDYQGAALMSDICSANKWKSCLCICQTINDCNSPSTAYCAETDFVISGFSSYRQIALTGHLPMVLQINQDTKTVSA